MKIQFIGAAGEVTGSCTLLEVNERYYLIDCGMEQGLDVLQNVPLPIPAAEIDAVFLTHAHIDHSGMLPRLYKEGFRGIIFATEATAMLCDIMLRDSAHIQMLEAEWKNRKAARDPGEPRPGLPEILRQRRARGGDRVPAAAPPERDPGGSRRTAGQRQEEDPDFRSGH